MRREGTQTMTYLEAPMKHLWKTVLVAGLTSVVLGALVLVWPGISLLVAAVLFGMYLVVSGVAEVFFAFSLHTSVPHRILLFIAGVLAVILGVFAFRHFGEGYAVLLLAIWVGIGFVFQGVAIAATAISYPTLPGRGWNIVFGVISSIAGVVVLAWPFSSIVMMTLVVGVWLVVLGSFQIVSAITIRKDFNALDREVSDAWGVGSDQTV